ncbi:phospholipase D-like domain-containing protein [Neolewinella antarctica]|uniref:Phospholipase D-like domain-containing protein n=1 Tax=Neolewinella antarctica TaxID=442734 RepID=A0ABX0XI76_9BACT|nr:phospholipase D-like domain-containing protein [Neolewinella antarctica]NJC28528.1 hypothetical protein [Neolewinella antarctica]
MIEVIENPITSTITSILERNSILKEIRVIVPYVTRFARKIFTERILSQSEDKKIIVRLEPTNLITFDLATVRYLLDHGFKIKFNNNVHTKLYLLNGIPVISSSNLTQGGFEDNHELSVVLEEDHYEKCKEVFGKLWKHDDSVSINQQFIEENWNIYLLLKKQSSNRSKKLEDTTLNVNQSAYDIDTITKHIIENRIDLVEKSRLVNLASTSRRDFVQKMEGAFDITDFHSPEGHPKRYECLFYILQYGIEKKLAGTGLVENQFTSVFYHEEFEQILNYILPQRINMPKWNLDDKEQKIMFCSGLFDFKIKQYSTTIPVRLASYFYPDHFLPIFNFSHLKGMHLSINGRFNSGWSKGEQLFYMNDTLINFLTIYTSDNYTGSDILYQLFFTIEYLNRTENGDTIEEVRQAHRDRKWSNEIINYAPTLIESIK